MSSVRIVYTERHCVCVKREKTTLNLKANRGYTQMQTGLFRGGVAWIYSMLQDGAVERKDAVEKIREFMLKEDLWRAPTSLRAA